jgi:hypothetical protein
METRLIDRFSDASDVPPEDVWENAPGHHSDTQSTATALPPKRPRVETPSTSADDCGLRIVSRVPTRSDDEYFPPLEVQEINGSVVRLDPEEPTAPRMPRQITFQERPACQDENRSGTGETNDWGSPKNPSIIWILGTGMAVAAMVIGAMALLPFVNKSNAARPRSGQSEWVLDPEDAITSDESLSGMLARQAEAERIFHAFISAPSAETILPLVRNPEKMAGLIHAGRYPAGAFASRRVPKATSWSVLENQGVTCGILKGALPDHSKFNAYFVVSQGRLVLDWKASTAYGTASFMELLHKQGNPAEIRAWITPAEFYTRAFPESFFQCYQLVSPDHQQSVWAYSPRGSVAHKALNALIKGGYILQKKAASEKATVRLEPGPANVQPNQWLIGELLHKDWITP